MKEHTKQIIRMLVCVAIVAVFALALTVYTKPMEALSLDLSMTVADGASPEEWDNKGWTVFTQDGETVTELTPNGFGSFTGLELGQTFYFSRVLEEALDDPMLQLGTVDRNFSVFLDGELIYTDCPQEDNRMGYLHLPMNDYQRTEPLTISLPSHYQGKVLTIAQSFPEWSETPTVRAYPCSVKLYCAYAYESGLIAESFRTAILCFALFAIGVGLTLAFLRSHDGGTLCIAMVAFLWMTLLLTETTFFFNYFGADLLRYAQLINLFLAGILLVELSRRGGRGKRPLLALAAVYWLSTLVSVWLRIRYVEFPTVLHMFLAKSLQEWIATVGMTAVLILGALFWRREDRFHRLFIPLALAGEAAVWAWSLFTEPDFASKLAVSLSSGSITAVYYRLLYPLLAASLITAAVEAIHLEWNRRMEKRLLDQQHALAVESYENLRRHQEEVMLLRHDMLRHFHTLRDMSQDGAVTAYLTDLIGQNEKIRPVVHSGNEMLDTILNGRLSAAIDAGVRVEIVKAEAPAKLPLTDADLCSLVLNLVDNAVAAAAASGAMEPFLRLNIHVKGNFLAFVCENSAAQAAEVPAKKQTVPKHGLGLKIIRNITQRYEGMIDTEFEANAYRVRVVLPLL